MSDAFSAAARIGSTITRAASRSTRARASEQSAKSGQRIDGRLGPPNTPLVDLLGSLLTFGLGAGPDPGVINAVHADADSCEASEWSQILALYDQVLAMTPTPVIAMNRAIALAEVGAYTRNHRLNVIGSNIASAVARISARSASRSTSSRRRPAKAASLRSAP